MADERAAAAVSPALLAAHAGGPTAPLAPRARLSSKCRFFADAGHLLVVADAAVDQATADLTLAWGLAYRGD